MLTTIRHNKFTLIEVLIASTLFAIMMIAMLESFDGVKRNIKQSINREEVTNIGLLLLSEIQESVHQAAEIYNHVPISTTDDTEDNLFYKRLDWSALPERMGNSDLDYHNRLADFKGQTANLNDWKDSVGSEYSATFHENDIIYSIPPVNGPGIPAGSRGFAGNVLLLAKHLPPIEVILSPTDTTFETAKENPLSHLYKQLFLKGNQILVHVNKGDERMFSVDVIRFDVYYLTEDTETVTRKAVSATDPSKFREFSLRLVKGESAVYAVHSKLKSLKTNLDSYYNLDTTNNPNDFATIYSALVNSTGFYFDNINKRVDRLPIVHTIEYLDSTDGPLMYKLDDGGANGFTSGLVTDLIEFPDHSSHIFLDNTKVERGGNVSVAYNTKWTTGETLDFNKRNHVPWFAQQPELNTASPVSEYFPGGFEITGGGYGANQRVGMRLNLWLRTITDLSAYSNYMIGARAQ